MTSIFNSRAFGSPPLTYQDASVSPYPVPYLPEGANYWGTGPSGGFGAAPGNAAGSSSMLGRSAAPGTSDVFINGVPGGGGKIIAPGPGGVLPMPGGYYPGSSSGGAGGLGGAIGGLLTPGLVPDIARQSAEVGSGRGVGGSPAGASTAVRMSEQDYLQRLGLANTLLSGEASRVLPYQITPYQQAELDLRKYALENQRYIEGLRGLGRTGNGYGSGGGGGTYRGIGVPTSPYSAPTVPPYGGTGFGTGPFGGGLPASAYMTGGGGGAGGGSPWTLNDAYDWLGFGDFGNQPGDTTTQFGQYPEPPDFEDQFWD